MVVSICFTRGIVCDMSWLPKRDKLDPVQASAVDFVVAQEGNFYIKGEAGTGKSVVRTRRNDGII